MRQDVRDHVGDVGDVARLIRPVGCLSVGPDELGDVLQEHHPYHGNHLLHELDRPADVVG